jgi:exopolyphosphatase / guanosine-5'-triphosphate,3'-diphosphate pyrophosphatase
MRTICCTRTVSSADPAAASEAEMRAACLLPSSAPPDAVGNPVRLCVVDLGTNSFHGLVVDVYANGTFKALDRIKELVRLGEQGLAQRRLPEAAIERAIGALRRIRLLADGWGVTDYFLCATSAIREAENGGDFIERVRAETGLHVQAITGDLEAQLIYEGVRRAVDLERPALLIDIGGGSTEFTVATGDEVLFQSSLKLGAARMAERFINTDPVDRSDFKEMRAHFREMLGPVFAAARQYNVREVVGSSGTVENLAQAWVNRYGDPVRSIVHQDIPGPGMRRITKKVMVSDRDGRLAMSGIDAKRVDQVVAGAMLLDVVLKDLEIERIRVSPNALREGMVVHHIRENFERIEEIAPYANVRRRSVYELGVRFDWEKLHAEHVASIALQLFDATASLHGLGHRERELLEYAALLHDIGYHISRRSHHKHSLYLIRSADMHGFLPWEIEVMAHVARYHRGSPPRKTHVLFQRLEKDHQQLVVKLAALLRLANGLDRSHFQNVTTLASELDRRRLKLTVTTRTDPQLDVWGARRAAVLFEEVFERKVVVKT